MTTTDGIYIDRTQKNRIQLTAQRSDQQITFTVSPETAQTLVSELQREVDLIQSGGSND